MKEERDINRLLKRLRCSSSVLLRKIFKTTKKCLTNTAIQKISHVVFSLFALLVYFTIDTFLWLGLSIGIPALLILWGISSGVADIIIVAILVLVLFLLSNFGRLRAKQRQFGGEAKSAYWVAQNLSDSKPQQWEEYQDWLHDILLARRQLLDAKCPLWKVKLITYKRLSAFCVVVGVSKVKQVATRIGRSL